MSFLRTISQRLARHWTPQERVALPVMFFPVLVYFVISLLRDRIFFFEDDLIRLTLAKFFWKMPLTLLAWGQETAWPPAGMIMQAVAQAFLPFGIKADVLLANLGWVLFCAVLIHRLARRIEPSWPALFPVVLFLTSPTALWMATSALIEAFFLALLLLEIYFLTRYFERGRFRSFVLATGCASLLTMIRFEGWVIGPAVLGVAVLADFFRQGRRAMRTAVVASLSLVLPLAWMLGSFLRYGDPLEFAKSHAQRLEEYYVPVEGQTLLGALMQALFQVADVAWLFFIAALVMFLWRLLRRDDPARSPAALMTICGFVVSFVLFAYFSLGRGYGLFQPRFIFVWYGAGLPLTVFLLRPFVGSMQKTIMAIATVVCLWSVVLADQYRPDIRESHGLRMLKVVERHAAGLKGGPGMVFLVPAGKLDYAHGAVLFYAPSIADFRLHPVVDNPVDEAGSLTADFVAARKEFYPGLASLPGYDLIYEDPTYRAFRKE